MEYNYKDYLTRKEMDTMCTCTCEEKANDVYFTGYIKDDKRVTANTKTESEVVASHIWELVEELNIYLTAADRLNMSVEIAVQRETLKERIAILTGCESLEFKVKIQQVTDLC